LEWEWEWELGWKWKWELEWEWEWELELEQEQEQEFLTGKSRPANWFYESSKAGERDIKMALREEIRDYLMQINSLLIISAIPPKRSACSILD